MAIIILQGADFSANNIGQIEVPVEFSNLTKSYLTRYGITIDETDNFQRKFNTFINSLSSINLLGDGGKIKSMCLPFMANIAQNGDLAYAQLNMIDGNNFFTANVTGSLSLTDKGLKPVVSQNVVKANFTDYVTFNNGMHMAAYNMTAETADESGDTYVFGYTTKTIGLVKYYESQGKSCLGTNGNAANGVYGSTTDALVSCMLIGNISSVNGTTIGKASLINNNVAYSKTDVPCFSGSLSNPVFGQYRDTKATYGLDGSVYSKASWGLLSIGEALTDEESLAYNAAVDTLMTYVKASL